MTGRIFTKSYLLGRFGEAQDVFRELLRANIYGSNSFAVQVFAHLLTCLLEQERYEEINHVFDLLHKTTMRSDYLDLVQIESSLVQQVNVSKTLTTLEKISKLQRTPYNIAVNLTLQAWANTLNARPQSRLLANDLLINAEQIAATANFASKYNASSLHYRIGYVRELRGEKTSAAEHFMQAQTVDPESYRACPGMPMIGLTRVHASRWPRALPGRDRAENRRSAYFF